MNDKGTNDSSNIQIISGIKITNLNTGNVIVNKSLAKQPQRRLISSKKIRSIGKK